MDAPRRDQLLLGDFEVLRTIGAGGMGVVFEVASRKTGVHYAAKKVLRAGDRGARDRFRREAELLARCDRHPGIVKVHTYGEAPDGSPCMILDLVRGEGLEKVLEREVRLPPRRAAEVARDVARALAFVHSQGVVHRDVKPSNILIDEGATPRLTDFGLATASDLERLTRTGQFVGTLFYCAPEQTAGQSHLVGPWTDVYALGAVLFHMLAGEPPLGGDTPVELMARLNDPAAARDVRTLAPEVPEPLAAIVAHALEKEPARRYRSGGELAQDLERFLAGQPVGAASAARRSRAGQWLRRLLVGSIAVVALAAAGLGARSALRARERDRALADAASEIESARRLLATPARIEKEGTTAVREAIGRGEDRLGTALALGADDAGLRRAALDALALDLATVEAGRELARGAPARALEVLDGARGSLPPAGRLARARALAALGRGPEASRELEAVLPVLPAELRAEAAEVRGDIFASTGDWAHADAEYGRALDAGSRAELVVRAKRGGAAALAGDRATAFACARAVLPDAALAALPEERAANERLAPLAPALYLRATTATTTKEKLRFLEAASRLADEPEPLRRAIAQAWYDVALDESDLLVNLLVSPRLTGSEKGVRRAFQHFGRAVALDPKIKANRYWGALGTLTVWAHNVGQADPAGLAAFLAQLLGDLPDQPVVLFLNAQTLDWERAPARQRAVELLRRALEKLPPQEPDEDPEILQIASELVVAHVRACTQSPPGLDRDALRRDIELVRAVAAHAGTSDAWFHLSHGFTALGDFATAHDCVERGAGLPRMQGLPASDEPLVDARISVLIPEGKHADAYAIAKRFYDEFPGDEQHAFQLLRALNGLGRFESANELIPDVSRVENPGVLVEIGLAAVRLGLGPRVKETIERLEARHSFSQARVVRAEWDARR
jgi:tetratricopeptide (TPR) repeat protein